jgi:hypothetical protein
MHCSCISSHGTVKHRGLLECLFYIVIIIIIKGVAAEGQWQLSWQKLEGFASNLTFLAFISEDHKTIRKQLVFSSWFWRWQSTRSLIRAWWATLSKNHGHATKTLAKKEFKEEKLCVFFGSDMASDLGEGLRLLGQQVSPSLL